MPETGLLRWDRTGSRAADTCAVAVAAAADRTECGFLLLVDHTAGVARDVMAGDLEVVGRVPCHLAVVEDSRDAAGAPWGDVGPEGRLRARSLAGKVWAERA